MKCLAVDDEPLALRQLATYIQKVPGLELVGQCSSAIQALDVIRHGGVDLLFSDINMPDMNGMELVKQIGNECLVVFTTAYADYAIEGYKVEAVDYLLKPFGLSDVVAAAEKARRRLDAKLAAAATSAASSTDSSEASATNDEINSSLVSDDGYIFIKADSKMHRVNIKDILLVEGMSEYVRIYVEGQPKPLTTLVSMKRMEQALPADNFMRVHRSWIVNLSKIESVSHLRISIGGQLIPVSDNFKDRFMDYVDSHFVR